MTGDLEARRSRARTEEIVQLLTRHRVLTTFAGRQQTARRDLLEQMQRRENLAELQRHLRGLHPADLASILSSLPHDERLIVWRQLPRREAALILVEAESEVRASILEAIDREEMDEAIAELDADDLAYLSEWLPPEALAQASAALARATAPGSRHARRSGGLGRPADDARRRRRREDQTVGEAIAHSRARAGSRTRRIGCSSSTRVTCSRAACPYRHSCERNRTPRSPR